MATKIHYDQELDATDMGCPKPVIHAKKALNTMQSGQILHVITKDTCSIKNFQSFSKQSKNELVESYKEGNLHHYYLRKE